MKILHVIPNLAKGGAERVTIDLANQQVANGNDVFLLFANNQHSQSNFLLLNKKVRILYIRSNKKSLILNYFSSAAWVIRHVVFLRTFDVLHTHLTFGLIIGALTKVIALSWANKKTKLVFTCHLVGMNVSRYLIFFTRLNSLFYDSFVLMAHDRYWDERIVKNRKFICIENGIEPLRVNRYRESSALRIGSLGRLVKDRKPELIINLFSEIEKVIDNTEFIVGGDGALRLQLLDSLWGSDAVRVVEFQGLIDSPSDFYSNLDFYITMNVGGTTGISGLEAVSSGIPTLAIQLDSLYENGEQDWIPSFSSNSLFIQYLQELIENKEALLALTMKQKATFDESFTVESMASKYYAIYSK
jgi:glycosyltransferase involved in cell wall biosynthesis